ncbi:MAG: hypothetical protein QXI10_03785 [Candidatus Diapherotrites archaeon]
MVRLYSKRFWLMLICVVLLSFSLGCIQKKEVKTSPTPSLSPSVIVDDKPFVPRQSLTKEDPAKKLSKPYDCSDQIIFDELKKKFGPGFDVFKETPKIGVINRKCFVSKGNSLLFNFVIIEYPNESSLNNYFDSKKNSLKTYFEELSDTNFGFGSKAMMFSRDGPNGKEFLLFFIDDSEKNVYVEITAFGSEQKEAAINFGKMLNDLV